MKINGIDLHIKFLKMISKCNILFKIVHNKSLKEFFECLGLVINLQIIIEKYFNHNKRWLSGILYIILIKRFYFIKYWMKHQIENIRVF